MSPIHTVALPETSSSRSRSYVACAPYMLDPATPDAARRAIESRLIGSAAAAQGAGRVRVIPVTSFRFEDLAR